METNLKRKNSLNVISKKILAQTNEPIEIMKLLKL